MSDAAATPSCSVVIAVCLRLLQSLHVVNFIAGENGSTAVHCRTETMLVQYASLLSVTVGLL